MVETETETRAMVRRIAIEEICSDAITVDN